jgi:hypothetical protein
MCSQPSSTQSFAAYVPFPALSVVANGIALIRDLFGNDAKRPMTAGVSQARIEDYRNLAAVMSKASFATKAALHQFDTRPDGLIGVTAAGPPNVAV